MMWIYLVFIAQILSGAVILLDKFLVSSRAISNPTVYTIFVGLLSGVVIVVFPLVTYPTVNIVGLSFVIAFTYIFSIFFLYKSLKISDASDVAPVMGAVSAVATFGFSLVILGDALPSRFFVSFVFLVVGTLIMSHFRFSSRSVLYVVIAGVLFGLSSVYVKKMFLGTDFLTGFFWSRMANVVGALALLAWPSNFKAFLVTIKESSFNTKFLVVANKALAGTAFWLILVAIKLGEVSLVNAMAGMQFIFVLIFAFIFTKKLPRYFSEKVTEKNIFLHKFVSTALIVIGFFLLFI